MTTPPKAEDGHTPVPLSPQKPTSPGELEMFHRARLAKAEDVLSDAELAEWLVRKAEQAEYRDYRDAAEVAAKFREAARRLSRPQEGERAELSALIWRWWRSPSKAVYPDKPEPDVVTEMLWNAGYRKAPPHG